MPQTPDPATVATRRRGSSWLLLVAVLVTASAAFGWLQHQGAPSAASAGRVADVASETRGPAAAPPKPVRVAREPQDPERLRIPALGVDAPVLAVTSRQRTLVPPRDPSRLGWWADGARPGDSRGSALVTGHTVHTGGGALEDLETLRRGDRLEVRAGGALIAYRVQSVVVLTKGALAREAERLFAQDVPGRLVLVTCEDWDGAQYLSNVVVTARPVS